MRLELDPGAPLIAYGLELNGARALERSRAAAAAAAGTEPEPVLWKKDYTRRTEWFLEHHLMVSHFRCVLELALRETPDTELVTWSQGKDIWFRVMIPGERKRIVRVAADSYFVLRQGGQLRHFFLEADRSTEEHRRLIDKFVGYWQYLQDAPFGDPSRGRARVNVLFVTTGEERLTNLVDSLRGLEKPNRSVHGGKGAFWFTSSARFGIEDPASILRAIWTRASVKDNALVSLISPKEESR
jgi:hypothetical protein